jgi:hypothetical protein
VRSIHRPLRTHVEKNHRVRLHVVCHDVELLSLPSRPPGSSNYRFDLLAANTLAKCNHAFCQFGSQGRSRPPPLCLNRKFRRPDPSSNPPGLLCEETQDMKRLLILLAVALLPVASGCCCARLCPCCPCNWFNRCAPACPPTYAAPLAAAPCAPACAPTYAPAAYAAPSPCSACGTVAPMAGPMGAPMMPQYMGPQAMPMMSQAQPMYYQSPMPTCCAAPEASCACAPPCGACAPPCGGCNTCGGGGYGGGYMEPGCGGPYMGNACYGPMMECGSCGGCGGCSTCNSGCSNCDAGAPAGAAPEKFVDPTPAAE